MDNGCRRIFLRDDLLEEVRRLSYEGRFDYLFIESTGVSEPMPVAETFYFRDEAGFSLEDISTLDTMLTVVDAANLNETLVHQKLWIADKGCSEDERTIVICL